MLKLVMKEISIPFNDICLTSFSEGIFPDKNKLAKAIPSNKKGSIKDVNNYRSISPLPICSKIMEKMMATRLTNYLELHDTIYPKQFGFRLHDIIYPKQFEFRLHDIIYPKQFEFRLHDIIYPKQFGFRLHDIIYPKQFEFRLHDIIYPKQFEFRLHDIIYPKQFGFRLHDIIYPKQFGLRLHDIIYPKQFGFRLHDIIYPKQFEFRLHDIIYPKQFGFRLHDIIYPKQFGFRLHDIIYPKQFGFRLHDIIYPKQFEFRLHDIIYPKQFEFRAGFSITHSLISITETIKKTLDKKKYGCGVFIDLKKSFNTVNHGILFYKLEHYGIRGVSLLWFKSYLSERKQFVHLNGIDSEVKTITCGVPRGLPLAPTLFTIYKRSS